MSGMFAACGGLTTLDVRNFDTANVTDISYMFYDCSNLTEIIYGSNFIHKNDANVISMFEGCPANKPTHESWSGVL